MIYLLMQYLQGCAPYIAVFFMICAGSGLCVLHASLFLILIDTITWLNDAYMVIPYEWLMILFSFISLYFARLSLKSPFLKTFPYLGFSIAYFMLGIGDIIDRGGLMDKAFYYVMYGLVTFLVFSVIYNDRMGNIKRGANCCIS